MKNSIYVIIKTVSVISILFIPSCLFAQDTTETAATTKKELIKGTFENSIVLNNQTIENTRKKSLDFMMQHRFGLIESEKDLWGIYGPANIRLGLAYGINKFLSVGVGVTKFKMIYDFQAKASILKQTKGKGMPVSLTYYGNIGRSAEDEDKFKNQDGNYKATNRLTYFNELMVARKFNSHISLQLGVNLSHMNLIDSSTYHFSQHDFVGLSFVGRYKFSPQSSVMIDVDYLVNVSDIAEENRPKPNMTIGYEVSTGSHQFQVFVGTAQNIINQEYRVYNQNQWKEWQVVFGFNITRIWDFN